MKKTVFKATAFLLALCLTATLLSSCGESVKPKEGVRVAEIVSSTGINDGSFNYMINRTCTAFCGENNIPFRYYVVKDDNFDSYLSMIDAAIDDDYNVIVCNSSMSRAVKIASKANPEIKFIGLDISKDDIAKNGEIPPNVNCSVFKEEYAGFMAGYAAVMEGYRHLGFVGGVPVAAVIRYGYGFLQGVNEAAKARGITDKVLVDYVYANQFFGDSDITAYMDNWYANKKVEAVFCCGGKVWTSVASAAGPAEGRIIGVDVDQDEEINKYTGKKTALCSSMKSLDVALTDILTSVTENNWSKYGGKFFKLGIVNRDDPKKNYVQISYHSELMKNFTYDDYKELVRKLYDGELKVSDDVTRKPDLSVKVNYAGNIK